MAALGLSGLITLAACTPRAPSSADPPDPPLAATTVEPWSFHGRAGRVVLSPSYRLFTTESDGLILRRLPTFLEASLDHYVSALGPLPRPAQPLDTFLFAHRWQWERQARELLGDAAQPYLWIRRGGFAVGGRALLYSLGTRDTFFIAAHEGWHQYTQRVFRLALPAWVEEGAAAYMEGHRWDPARPALPRFLPWANPDRFDQLRTAAATGRLLPLPQLLQTSPEQLLAESNDAPLTYYAQLWALMHFLQHGADARYRRDLHRLLAEFADGRARVTLTVYFGPVEAERILATRSGPAVFLAYFGQPELVAQEFDGFVERLVRTGSKDRIIAGEHPFQR